MRRPEIAKRTGRRRGFTLLELMIVLMIVSVLAAVAFPSYTRHVQRSRRTDAHSLLMRIAAEQERFYTQFNRYTANLGAPASSTNLGMAQVRSENGFYTASAVLGNVDQTYTLTATPIGQQSGDACGAITLGSSDQRGFAGNESNGPCW
jgi:type IV pilus assembly protein PilE